MIYLLYLLLVSAALKLLGFCWLVAFTPLWLPIAALLIVVVLLGWAEEHERKRWERRR
jgi:hypothetical protein